MTPEQINTAKERMARFMGAELDPNWTSAIYKDAKPTWKFTIPPTKDASYHWSSLHYDTSMDWLHPVVQKIGGIEHSYTIRFISDLRHLGMEPIIYDDIGVIFKWADKVLQYLEQQGKL